MRKVLLLIISFILVGSFVYASQEVKYATVLNVITGQKRIVEVKPGQFKENEMLWVKDVGARTDSVWKNYGGNYYFSSDVGIGTTTPGEQLHIVNPIKAATTTMAIGSVYNTKLGKICLWNTTNYSIISFAANSATVSVATSTTCE